MEREPRAECGADLIGVLACDPQLACPDQSRDELVACASSGSLKASTRSKRPSVSKPASA
jgi:hypothetical protein